VYVCICVCVFVYASVCTHMCVDMCLFVHVFLHVCLFVVYISVYIGINLYRDNYIVFGMCVAKGKFVCVCASHVCVCACEFAWTCMFGLKLGWGTVFVWAEIELNYGIGSNKIHCFCITCR